MVKGEVSMSSLPGTGLENPEKQQAREHHKEAGQSVNGEGRSSSTPGDQDIRHVAKRNHCEHKEEDAQRSSI